MNRWANTAHNMTNATDTKKYAVASLLLGLLCGCQIYTTPVKTGEKIMSELTKTMQPLCVGRYNIEIPRVARIDGWSQELDSTKIETISPPSLTQKIFNAKVVQFETRLKTSPHDTEGTLLKNKLIPTANSVLFAYRKDKQEQNLIKLDALYWHPTFEYFFKSKTTNKFHDAGIARVSKVVKSFVPKTEPEQVNLPPGLCVENGVFIGSEFRGESVSINGSIDDYPGYAFLFSTQSTDKKHEEPGLISRITASLSMGDSIGNEVSAATRFIRKGKRSLNGQPGEELVAIGTIEGKTYYEANAEFYGEPYTLEKPDLTISMSHQTHDENTHEPYKKTLTEKEFMALWDSLLNGIRPRTSSLWGDAAKK